MRGATPRVMLAWARDRTGARVHVLDLDRRGRAGRAPFACPRCRAEVLARLGRVRAPHFAHLPGSFCDLTSPESALHHNVKERLLWLCEEAFAGRRLVKLEVRCPGCRRRSELDVSDAGDRAVEEGAVGTRRVDVLVTRRGRPSLALEVRVSHALEPEKEEALADLALPAAEIDARADWERGDGEKTLLACARSLGFSPCPACASLSLSERDRARGGEGALVAELEAYRARGLFGPKPKRPIPDPKPFSAAERRELARAFFCPQCAGTSLEIGLRLARHGCRGAPPRAVAWRGYDGELVRLGPWRRR